MFWKHAYDLINSGPDLCNQKVADIVEKDRVYRAQRGQDAHQVVVKPTKLVDSSAHLLHKESPFSLDITNIKEDLNSYDEDRAISWLGGTNLAVGTSEAAANLSDVDCILNCDDKSLSVCLPDFEAYLHLPMLTSKFDRFSLLKNLPSAVKFARLNLSKGKKILICCHNGEDISVCVCLAILISLFDDGGTFDDGKFFSQTCITKWEMRRRLVLICKFAVNSRPSRGNLKQVFSFLNGGRVNSDGKQEPSNSGNIIDEEADNLTGAC